MPQVSGNALAGQSMRRFHRDTVTYWVFVAVAVAFTVFNIYVLGLMLSMSITGRLRGGVSLNLIATIDVLLWAFSLAAFDGALWKFRLLPSDLQMMSLGRQRRPEDPLIATAWRWTRAAWVGWLLFMALMFATALIMWLLDPSPSG